MSSTRKTSVLDSPVVKAVCKKFNRRRVNCTLTGEELIPLFMDVSKPISVIARLANTTRAAMNHLYNHKFKDLIGSVGSGKERLATHKLRKTNAVTKTIDNTAAGLAARLARKHGLPFKRKLGSNEKPLVRVLEINGRECYVLLSRSSFQRKTGGWYNSFSVTLAEAARAKIVICIVGSKTEKHNHLSELGTYIIPAETFAQDSGVFYRLQVRDESKGRPVTRTLPTMRTRDWGQYKDAWHLLE